MNQDDISYKSWIKLAEQADKTIAALAQHAELITIGDKNDVYANSVIIFDTSRFSEQRNLSL